MRTSENVINDCFLHVSTLKDYSCKLHAVDCEHSLFDSEPMRAAKELFYKDMYFSGELCIGCEIASLASALLNINKEYKVCIDTTLKATYLAEKFMKEEGDEGS